MSIPNISRRELVAGALAMAAASSLASPSRAAARTAPPPRKPLPTNPRMACGAIHTIVTPDFDRSVRVYTDVFDYSLERRGRLNARIPTIRGAGERGREYALIRSNPESSGNEGLIRLLAAPPGAPPNRPRPRTEINVPGLASMELITSDDRECHRRLTEAGVYSISPPMHYYHGDMLPLNGTTVRTGIIEVTSFAAHLPGTEQTMVTQVYSHDKKPFAYPYPRLISPITGHALSVLDKWAVRRFYGAAFGLLADRDAYIWGQNDFNALMGSPKDTHLLFGGMGDGFDMEVWEYRQWDPTVVKPLTTELDRTGLAMTTVEVADVARHRAMVREAGIPIIGEGALPTPEHEYQEGFYIRGPVGELLEVVARPT